MRVIRSLLPINYRRGRESAFPVDVIVIHVTEGSANATRAWFNDPDSSVSAHYLVRTDGVVEQFVSEDDTAWANGRVHAPTAQLVLDRAPANPNRWTISIEHEGDGTHELTEPQRAASVELIRDICARRSIPIDRDHIIGHHEIYSLKTCPGAINVDRLVFEASGAGQPAIEPAPPDIAEPPQVVWSNFLRDWLIVTRVASDTDWSFVPAKELALVASHRAIAPLSQMPAGPE